jgi:hypothetical protein
MAEGLAERYDGRIAGVLSCYDRIVITGTVPGICHAQGMTAFLRANAIRIFDYEAALALEANGWKNVRVMEGGIMAWPFKREK